MPSKPRQLIIKLTTGIESPEKLSQAFNVAATALASGGGFRPSWQHLRFEVLLAWALRAPAADKPTYPLKPFTLGPGFLSTLDGLQGIQRSKVVDVVVEVVTGLVAQFRPRQLHGLRDGTGRPRTRPGTVATALRASLQHCSLGARRLHSYRSAAGVEPSRVGPHDDYRP